MLQRVLVRDWVRALPDVARLLWRLVRDERVPMPIKVGLGGFLAYVAVPIDVIPDWIPFAGRIDDTLIAALGVRALLRRVDEDVLVEHWPANPDVLGRLLGKELPRQHLIPRDAWDAGSR